MNIDQDNLLVYIHWTCLLKAIKDNKNKKNIWNWVNKIKRRKISIPGHIWYIISK
jgi:hypothetical protein